MTVAELIEILKTMPQDCQVEINDNHGGNVFDIDQVDHFEAEDDFAEVVVIQVNV